MPAARHLWIPMLLLSACATEAGREEIAAATDAATVTGATAGSIGGDLSAPGVALSAPASARRSRAPMPAPPERQSSAPAQVRADAMLIRTGSVSVRVDSVEPAMEAVKGLAARLGGMVAGITVMNGDNEVRGATLELRVPSARFDEAMSGVRPLGRVEHSTTSAVDVGEEYVDISARVANAKRLEQRLITLLATRTGKLEDVLAVERELARVREEIERHEGRIRYFDSRIAMSSVSVTVHEKPPIVATHPGANPIRLAFVRMWRNFVMFVAAGIEALGVVIPVAVLALAGFAGWKRWRRTRSVLATATTHPN